MNDDVYNIMLEFMDSEPEVIAESEKTKAKKLLKNDKMAQGKNEHARGMRAYLRAVASGRDAAYLLTQKGKIGEGAKHAKKLLSEDSSCAANEIMVFGKCRDPKGGLKTKTDDAHDHLQRTVGKHGINHVKTQRAAQQLSRHIGDGEGKPHHVKAIKDLAQKQKDWAAKQGTDWRVTADTDIEDGLAEGKDPIGKSKNAKTFRWLAGQTKVGQTQHSTNRADNHDGITPAFLKKMQRLGYIKIVSSAHGETDWKLLKALPMTENLFERTNSKEKALIAKIQKASGDGDGQFYPGDEAGDPASGDFEFEFDSVAKSFARKAKSLGAKVGKPTRSRQRGEGDHGPKFLWTVSVSLPKSVTEDFTAAELDSWWSGARAKLIKGSRATRQRRMAGCVKSLRALRDGGIKVSGLSHTDKNPVPRKERDSEDQPVDSTPGKVDEDITIEETHMNLNDAIARFRSLDEANIPAPSVSRTQPGGGNQFSSKSKFKYYGGADQDYQGGSISIPADAEAKAAMSHSSNVKGPVGADAREYVDVRIEDTDPDQLVAMLEQIAEAADSLEEYAQLIETHLGFDMVCKVFKVAENVENPELLLGRIYEGVNNPVQGDGPVVNNPNDPMSEANRGVGTDDFVENSTDAEDHAFAQGMMRGDTRDADLSIPVAESAIPAPDPKQTGPDGKQIASKSRFRKYYPGPGQTYTGDPAAMAADPETHAAMSHSAGANGPGYTPDNREEIDVRVESARQGQQFQPQANGQRPPEPSTTNELDAFAASMSYPTDLIQK